MFLCSSTQYTLASLKYRLIAAIAVSTVCSCLHRTYNDQSSANSVYDDKYTLGGELINHNGSPRTFLKCAKPQLHKIALKH